MHSSTEELLPIQKWEPYLPGTILKYNFWLGLYKPWILPQIRITMNSGLRILSGGSLPPIVCKTKLRQSNLQVLGKSIINVCVWEFLIWFPPYTFQACTLSPVLNMHDNVTDRPRWLGIGKCPQGRNANSIDPYEIIISHHFWPLIIFLNLQASPGMLFKRCFYIFSSI